MDRAEKLTLARAISDALLERHGEAIVATGVHGSVARGEDSELSDIDFVVVAADGAHVPARSLMHGAVIVDVGVTTREAYLAEAAAIGPRWPLQSDQYVNALALHDPTDFFKELRLAHDRAVAEAPDQAFKLAAGQNVVEAIEWAYKARANVGQNDAAATVAVAESALAAACALGLMARFPFKNTAAALRIAPDLPVAPKGFAQQFRAALAPGAYAGDAVAALENALEMLVHDALARGVLVAAEGPADFL